MIHSNKVPADEFGKLLERYRPEIQAHCYRLLGTVVDAEDMVQESFLKALNHREELNQPSALRAWLYRIATNSCLDMLRQQERRFVPQSYQAVSTVEEPIPGDVNEPIWLEPYPSSSLAGTIDSPEDLLITRENISLAFITALQVLRPRQRAILLLRDVVGWHAEEVATHLNMTVSAVKSTLHRARSTLAKHQRPADTSMSLTDQDLQLRLEHYIRAWEQADIDSFVALLSQDAIFSMPPIPSWYQGRAIIHALVTKTVFAGNAAGRWRMMHSTANGQPALGLYRNAGDHYSAYGIQVLTLHDGQISDVITFRTPKLFPMFNLPQALLLGAEK